MKTKIKKILALILCISIIFGTVAAGHTEWDFSVSASESDLTIPTYAELVKTYCSNASDRFIYVGAEYYEEDGFPTDYKVYPGDRLVVFLRHLSLNFKFNGIFGILPGMPLIFLLTLTANKAIIKL
ncbi:MAG: hypothetical protein IJB16_08255 [Clostridia bacterium]|nr:hypothetical protein [Clostridia bacterium]